MSIKSIIRLIKKAMAKISSDFVGVFSAQAAFFIILSFFPFTMFLLTLLQYLPITESDLMGMFTNIMPRALDSYIIMIIQEIYDRASGTVISITVITTLWSASKGFLAIVRGLNSVYDIDETRNYFKLRFMSVLYTLVFSLLLIVTLGLLVFGNKLYFWIDDKIPMIKDVALILISVRTAVSLTILTLFFLILYVAIPDRKTKILRELPGALFASSGWLLTSYLYSFYIDHMSGFSTTYGSLTAIVFLMLWLYFCMYLMFLGGELNVLLHHWKTKKL